MLLCADFDDTLNVHGCPEVFKRNLRAVRRWRELGHNFGLTTGRNMSILRQIFPNWQQQVDFVATDNGGAIFSHEGELWQTRPLESGMIASIERLAGANVQPAYYTAFNYGIQYPKESEVIKLRLWFLSPQEALTAKGKLEHQFGNKIQVLPWLRQGYSPLPGVDLSQYAGFLDVVSAWSGKQNAIKFVAERQNISEMEIFTVGDDYNDLAMLWRFQGYAIIGSDFEVVQAAQGRTVASVADLVKSLL